MAKLYVSDSHIGLDIAGIEHIVDMVTAIARNGALGCDGVVFNGDLLLGWKQQQKAPGWEGRVETIAGAFIDLLRSRGETVIAGNCEGQPEMHRLGMGQLPYAAYDQQTGALATHGHIAEPRSPIELVRNVPPAIAQHMLPVRKAFERLLGTRGASCFDVQGTAGRLHQALEGDPKLQQVLEQIDRGQHQSSTSLYLLLAGVSDVIPSFRKHFDALVRLSLDDYYVRTLIHAVRQLIQGDMIPPPRIVLYGHTHRPFILNRDHLQRSFDFGSGWLPEWIVNTGTMVPLTKEFAGTDDSHLVIVGDDGVPRLYRTTHAPILELVNVGGVQTSEKIRIAA